MSQPYEYKSREEMLLEIQEMSDKHSFWYINNRLVKMYKSGNGRWSTKQIEEAKQYNGVNIDAMYADDELTWVKPLDSLTIVRYVKIIIECNAEGHQHECCVFLKYKNGPRA